MAGENTSTKHEASNRTGSPRDAITTTRRCHHDESIPDDDETGISSRTLVLLFNVVGLESGLSPEHRRMTQNTVETFIDIHFEHIQQSPFHIYNKIPSVCHSVPICVEQHFTSDASTRLIQPNNRSANSIVSPSRSNNQSSINTSKQSQAVLPAMQVNAACSSRIPIF